MITPELIDWLKAQTSQGVPEEELRRLMREQGWEEADISSAIARLRAGAAATPVVPTVPAAPTIPAIPTTPITPAAPSIPSAPTALIPPVEKPLLPAADTATATLPTKETAGGTKTDSVTGVKKRTPITIIAPVAGAIIIVAMVVAHSMLRAPKQRATPQNQPAAPATTTPIAVIPLPTSTPSQATSTEQAVATTAETTAAAPTSTKATSTAPATQETAKDAFLRIYAVFDQIKTYDDVTAFVTQYESGDMLKQFQEEQSKLDAMPSSTAQQAKDATVSSIRTFPPRLSELKDVTETSTSTTSAALSITTTKPATTGTAQLVIENGTWKLAKIAWSTKKAQ